MNDALFIGIDIGTQGTKAVLTDPAGTPLSEAFCPSTLIRPDAVTVYEEPENMLNSVIATVKEVIEKAGVNGACVKAIGIDAQMAGIMGIGEDFSAVTPYDSWLDSRCEKYTELIKSEVGNEAIRTSGGQIAHTHASKILWWKNEHPEIYKNIKKFVMPNGFVAGKMCGLSAEKAFMDYTFLHFNVFSDNLNLCYNQPLLDRFGVDKDVLPEIVDPRQVIGTVTAEYAELCGLGPDCKMIAGCGDTAASSLGAGVVDEGLAYDVAGTASVFACSTRVFAPDVTHKTILFSRSVLKDLFLPLSYIGGGGLCLRWFSKLASQSLKELDGTVDASSICETPVFIPHFSGRTYPLDNDVSGAFLKINPNTDTAEMYRAVLESIAFEYKSYYDILEANGCLSKDTTVIGVGGGAKSSVFCQLKADVLGADYVVPAAPDSAPVAMALLAAKGIGYLMQDIKEIFGMDIAKTQAHTPNGNLKAEYDRKAKEYLNLLNGYSKYINNQ